MNKKFASLGTALSRDEAKKVMGGNESPTTTYDCTCTGSGTHGTCHQTVDDPPSKCFNYFWDLCGGAGASCLIISG